MPDQSDTPIDFMRTQMIRWRWSLVIVSVLVVGCAAIWFLTRRGGTDSADRDHSIAGGISKQDEIGLMQGDEAVRRDERKVRGKAKPRPETVMLFDQAKGTLSPEVIAKLGFPMERFDELDRMVGRYRQWSKESLARRLTLVPHDSDDPSPSDVYRATSPPEECEKQMASLNRELRSAFGEALADKLTASLAVAPELAGLWAEDLTVDFIRLPEEEGGVRWHLIGKNFFGDGTSTRNGIELIGRGKEPMAQLFGEEFGGLY